MQFNDNFFAEIGTSAPVKKICDDKAKSIADRARSTAPVETGEYRDGIKTSSKRARYRYVALVVATDPKSLLIEAKTGNLVKALRAERGG
jgi:hypothetical protein